MSKTRKGEERVVSFGRILAGGILGMILTLLLTFMAAFALSREWLSTDACSWIGPCILAVSACLCTWTAAAKNGKKMMSGMAAALLYGSALMIAGMLVFSAPMQHGRLALSATALLAGGLGGIVASGMRD